jgi:hypothetical protein
VAGGSEAQSGGQEGGSAVDAEDLVWGVEHMGIAGDGGEADAPSSRKDRSSLLTQLFAVSMEIMV